MVATSKLLQLTLCKDALFEHFKQSASQVQNASVPLKSPQGLGVIIFLFFGLTIEGQALVSFSNDFWIDQIYHVLQEFDLIIHSDRHIQLIMII